MSLSTAATRNPSKNKCINWVIASQSDGGFPPPTPRDRHPVRQSPDLAPSWRTAAISNGSYMRQGAIKSLHFVRGGERDRIECISVRFQSSQLTLGEQGLDEAEPGHVLDTLWIEHTVEMIEFVLKNPGVKPVSLAREFAAVFQRAAVR